MDYSRLAWSYLTDTSSGHLVSAFLLCPEDVHDMDKNESNGAATRYTLEGQIIKKRKRPHGLLLTVILLTQKCQDDNNDDDDVIMLADPQKYRILVEKEEAKLLCFVGAVIRAHGHDILFEDSHVGKTEQLPPLMQATTIHLVRCAPDPRAVNYVLNNFISLPLVTVLGGDCCVDAERIHTLASLPPNNRRRRLEVAKQVRLLGACSSIEKAPRQRTPHMKKADLQLLDDMECQIELYPLHDEREASLMEGGCEKGSNDLLINIPNDGDPDLVSSRGHMTRCDYYHRRKQPQVRWMVDKLKEMCSSSTCTYKHILDVGGGRGDLATAIALEFPSAHVTVIDRNAHSLQAGRVYSTKVLGQSNMNHIQFVQVDFLSFMLNKDEDAMVRPDVVVALHACGDLTDAVLDYARMEQIQFLICPCCYNKKLIGDAGCMEVSFTSWWDNMWCANDDDAARKRATLERLAESEVRSVSLRAATLINSMRLASFKQTLYGQEASRCLSLSLERFPSMYSLRNIVLVGKHCIT